MYQQMCIQCKQFLADFLEQGISKQLALSKELNMKALRRLLPELTDWMYRFYLRLPSEELDKAMLISARIARRERSLLDYEYLIHTATFNLLKYEVKWIKSEISYMETLLLEGGFVRPNPFGHLTKAYDYLSYTVPRVILVLQDLHEDHTNPKGLFTDTNKHYFPRNQSLGKSLLKQ